MSGLVLLDQAESGIESTEYGLGVDVRTRVGERDWNSAEHTLLRGPALQRAHRGDAPAVKQVTQHLP